MAKIGVLYGMEESFPPALVDRINAMGVGWRCGRASENRRRRDGRAQRLRRDRRPHLARHSVLPVVLKNAALTRHESHQQSVLVERRRQVLQLRAGRETRRRRAADVLLPHKKHPPGTTARSMRNLEYPLDWDGIFRYVGFPAFLKPHDGGGWKNVYKVDSPEEFFAAYDESGDLCMTLQAA